MRQVTRANDTLPGRWRTRRVVSSYLANARAQPHGFTSDNVAYQSGSRLSARSHSAVGEWLITTRTSDGFPSVVKLDRQNSQNPTFAFPGHARVLRRVSSSNRCRSVVAATLLTARNEGVPNYDG